MTANVSSMRMSSCEKGEPCVGNSTMNALMAEEGRNFEFRGDGCRQCIELEQNQTEPSRNERTKGTQNSHRCTAERSLQAIDAEIALQAAVGERERNRLCLEGLCYAYAYSSFL